MTWGGRDAGGELDARSCVMGSESVPVAGESVPEERVGLVMGGDGRELPHGRVGSCQGVGAQQLVPG